MNYFYPKFLIINARWSSTDYYDVVQQKEIFRGWISRADNTELVPDQVNSYLSTSRGSFSSFLKSIQNMSTSKKASLKGVEGW